MPVEPEVMIPLVGTKKELDLQADLVRSTAERVFSERNQRVKYLVGTMIEVPRAAVTAGAIAESAEFFSFGTNDLTQTTFGLSRDDVPKVLASYIEREVYTVDPFVSIDREGVGSLMKTAVSAGPGHPGQAQARHLRRARGRSGLGGVLPRDRARLRLLLALPVAHSQAGGGASGPAHGQVSGLTPRYSRLAQRGC